MKTIKDIVMTSRSPVLKIVADDTLKGAKFALQCGDEIRVSPAMWHLLSDDDGSAALEIAGLINVIPMVPAMAEVREIEQREIKPSIFGQQDVMIVRPSTEPDWMKRRLVRR